MSARPKFNYFLVHQETGQRYPVGEEVVIGRSSGDILFPDDAKVSTQHCRILKTQLGLAIHDFGSSNGTSLDGVRLDPKKMYALKPGNLITIGTQQIKLQETAPAKLLTRKRGNKNKHRKKKKGGLLDLPTFIALVLVVGAGSIILQPYFANFKFKFPQMEKEADVSSSETVPTPLELVEREMRSVFEEYKELGSGHTLGRISDREVSTQLRTKLIPRLKAARSKMEVLKGQTDWEKKKIQANIKLLIAVTGQTTAMMNFTVTKDAKFSQQLEKFSDQVEVANEEVQKLNDLRRPANL